METSSGDFHLFRHAENDVSKQKDHCGAALPGRGWLKLNTMTGVRSLMFAARLHTFRFFSDEDSNTLVGSVSRSMLTIF